MTDSLAETNAGIRFLPLAHLASLDPGQVFHRPPVFLLADPPRLAGLAFDTQDSRQK